jgi:hypothetical protein
MNATDGIAQGGPPCICEGWSSYFDQNGNRTSGLGFSKGNAMQDLGALLRL